MHKDSKKLPHLIKLLDDDSELVQKAIAKELAEYGPWLNAELSLLDQPLSDKQKKSVTNLLKIHNHILLQEEWKNWDEIFNEKEKLERAMSLLAQFQNGVTYPRSLKQILDTLAEEFISTRSVIDPFELANFLFIEKGLKGAEKDYYDPLNSNLVYVIENKRGIPISLAVIYMLVGDRVGLNIEGCNFPGHFLARVEGKDGYILVDCFNQGQLLHEKVITKVDVQHSESTREIIHTPATANVIMRRFLRNLIEAYKREEDLDTCEVFFELYHSIEEED